MVRIVDVYEFLKSYPFNKVDEEIYLSIEDKFFNENSGSYRISIQKGIVNITRINEEKGIQCSIQQLSSICLGFKRPKALFDNQLIFGNEKDINKMERIIPIRQTYFTDFF